MIGAPAFAAGESRSSAQVDCMELLQTRHVGQHVLSLLEPSRSYRVHPGIGGDHAYFAICLQQIGGGGACRDHRMCNDYRVPYMAYLQAFSHIKIRLFAPEVPRMRNAPGVCRLPAHESNILGHRRRSELQEYS